ncbi:endonuclease/exonuclease/phosphatase family protein [Agromyces soli]
MLARFLAWVVVLGSLAAAAVLVWPQAFGLQDQWVAAHVVALRGAGALAAVLVAVLFGLLALSRRARRFAIAMIVVLALFAAGNVAVLVARGLGGSDASAAAEASVTVLSWNTLGEVPDASTVAALALERGADVVVLPETTEPFGEQVALAMRDGGRPMWVHWQAFDDIAKARSTTLLVSSELGDYRVVTPDWPGPPDNTNTVPSLVAMPVDGDGPTIVAVHAVAPVRWEIRNWRSDLDWIAEQCPGGDVIMAGDFNATLDHFAGRGVDGGDLGACRDAAHEAGAAGVGTWPTDVPPVLGSPIDHVLASAAWRVEAFRVLDALDGSGSDHRPVVATLVRAG